VKSVTIIVLSYLHHPTSSITPLHSILQSTLTAETVARIDESV